MKILQGMDNIAGQAAYNTLGLREIGEDVKCVVYHESLFKYKHDLILNIMKSKPLLYPYYVIKLLCFNFYAMTHFDYFHFHFGKSMLPANMDIPILKFLKKKVFMEYHGGDIRWKFNQQKGTYGSLLEVDKSASDKEKKRIRRVFNNVDCVILHDSELYPHLVGYTGDIAYIPLRNQFDNVYPVYPDSNNQKPLIVHAPTKREGKGTDYVLRAIENLSLRYDFDFTLVEHKTNAEAKDIYRRADIIIDQLKAGTYGVFAIEAMAMGKPVVCYISEQMKREFPSDLPIVSASIYDIELKLEELIKDGKYRNEIGKRSRKYAEMYHNCVNDAKLLKDVYQGKYRNEKMKESFARVKAYSGIE